MKFLSRLPLWAELAIAVLTALVVSNVATFILLDNDRERAFRTLRIESAVERVATMAGLVGRLDDAARADLLSVTSARGERFGVDPEPWVGADNRSADIEAQLAAALALPSADIRASLLAPDATAPRRNRDGDGDDDQRMRRHIERLTISVLVAPGQWFNAQYGLRPPPDITRALLLSAGIAALVVTLVAIWMGARVAGPLRRLAEASTAMRSGEPAPPIPETGPAAVQQATRAFNAMSARLMATLEAQRAMMAAVAHDLRTPLTSLRLRTEFVTDPEVRARMVETLDELQAMTEAALDAARLGHGGEPMRAVDLAALVDSLAADLAELGNDVSCETDGAPLRLTCRPNDIRRAVRNLIENAVRYGTSARVAVVRRGSIAEITVDDDGPGIPADEIDRVFEPFVRLETSRSRETGGVGLGLSIARMIARAHGGDVSLENRAGGGLRAILRLPLG